MWIKLDDQWMDHPKMILAGRDARDVWLASITWCAKHLTDGLFPPELLPSLCVMAGVDVANCQTFATTLLDVCLWDATPNGYMVHDYLDYNPTKEQALATREARKQAGSAGGKAKASKMASKTLAKSWQNSAPYPSHIPSSDLKDSHTSETANIPENPTCDKLITRLTGWISIPYSEENTQFMRDVPTIIQRKGEETEIYLRGFWNAWDKRYPGSTRLGWIGWALTGQIPPNKPPKNGSKPDQQNPSYARVTE